MEVPIQELLGDFLREASVPAPSPGQDVLLEHLVDDPHSSSALFKRDVRRLLERDPAAYLQSACRILKTSLERPGAASLLEVLWSSPILLSRLIDPKVLSLLKATAIAKRWVAFDPTLDAKLLQIGFPFEDEDPILEADLVRSRRTLDIVSELPPNRHILLALAKLLRNPDTQIRSKAALLYSRASNNPEWVRKMLADPDARVRANAVEGLWETQTTEANSVFKEAALDPNHRVMANALVGLHLSGGELIEVMEPLHGMTRRPEPTARAAAAFAMGRIKHADCIPILECLLKDTDQTVRGQALQALIRIRRHEPAPVAEPPVEAPVAPEQPALAPTAEVVIPPANPAAEEPKLEPVNS